MVNTNKIKGKIAENGYTQESLANAVGMSRTTLRRKIEGNTDLTVSEVEALCKALKISENELLLYFFYNASSQIENINEEEGA